MSWGNLNHCYLATMEKYGSTGGQAKAIFVELVKKRNAPLSRKGERYNQEFLFLFVPLSNHQPSGPEYFNSNTHLGTRTGAAVARPRFTGSPSA